MTQYLVAVNHADDYAPPAEQMAQIMKDVDALNAEMQAAGAWVFAGGLHPTTASTTLRVQDNGEVLVTDGPFVETKEHIGGFWVLNAADLDEALAWGRKATVACQAPIEVRPFQDEPPATD